MPKLSDEQIQQKLTEGRNYKRLYRELKHKFGIVVEEHKQCPKLIAELTAKYDAIIEKEFMMGILTNGTTDCLILEILHYRKVSVVAGDTNVCTTPI